jgi:ribosomal-protein-alanine N-acetyltransferase
VIDSGNKTGLVQDKPQENDRGLFAFGDAIRFRPMTMADMDEIMAIERTAYRYPWSQGFFLQELQVACARSILAELDGKIVGYVLFWLLPGTIDIHNLATHVDFRRCGVARRLLKRVLSLAEEQSIGRVTLEVRKSNTPAQKLYESMGFLTTGLRKGYYSDNGEDALAMALELSTGG